MKVLWFSNTTALGDDYINKSSTLKGTGGWMYALNVEMQNEVELFLAFHYPHKIKNFKYQKTNYYPIYTGNMIVENLKKRFLGKVYDQDFLESYLNIVDRIKPDIIHIHGTENSFLCILDKVNIPIVISIQGNLSVIHHKYRAGFSDALINKRNEDTTIKSILFGKMSFLKSYKRMKRMAKVEFKHLKFAQNIIGRTGWDKRVTRVLAPNSTYYEVNELLRSDFYCNEWDNLYNSGKILVFTTNGNSYYKGFETLCHALYLLNNLGLEVEWKVAGIAENSLINKITKKQLKENYPKFGLTLLGSVEQNELIKNMQEAHLYVMPSHIENSPNNLCEAMILGMPSIATYAGGTGTILKDRENGILIQDGDPWVMAGAIIELINDSKVALKYAKNAREKALKRHDKATIVSELIETYSKIIKKQQ
jgi:glycosyltransferase involved in cell wall biosynthesis